MAAKQTLITVTHGNESYQTVQDKMLTQSSKPIKECQKLENFFAALASGTRSASFTAQCTSGDRAAATGTFTFSNHAAASDTVLINGVTFTAETSGATGNQWNIGSTATQTAANLAAAINASTTALVSGTVVATANAGVVTITSLVSGQVGNAITLAKGVDSGSVNTVSGARLTGGAAPTSQTSVTTFHRGV